jgi:hypothetical protein
MIGTKRVMGSVTDGKGDRHSGAASMTVNIAAIKRELTDATQPLPFRPTALTWKNVTYTLTTKTPSTHEKMKKTLLHHVSG